MLFITYSDYDSHNMLCMSVGYIIGRPSSTSAHVCNGSARDRGWAAINLTLILLLLPGESMSSNSTIIRGLSSQG